MLRLIAYSFIISIFIVIINLLKYANTFKNLTYESSILETITYVIVSFMGNGYIGIHPISKMGKLVIILLSFFKFLIIIELVMYKSDSAKYLNIFNGIKELISLEK